MVISAAQAVTLFRTQPLNFMEPQKSDRSVSNPFMARTFSSDNSPYTLSHPKISGSDTLAKVLDIDA